MSVLRAVANKHNARGAGTVNFTDAQIIVDLQVMTIEDHMRMCRLRYLVRFLRLAPPALIRLTLLTATCPSSWIKLIQSDLVFLWHSTEDLYTSMCDPGVDMMRWWSLIAAEPVA